MQTELVSTVAYNGSRIEARITKTGIQLGVQRLLLNEDIAG
jgi:hypothetical protein